MVHCLAVDDLLGGAESQSADDLLARLQAFMEVSLSCPPLSNSS